MVIGKVTTRSFHVAVELTRLVGTSYSHRLLSTSRNSRNQRPVFPVESTGTQRTRKTGYMREKETGLKTGHHRSRRCRKRVAAYARRHATNGSRDRKRARTATD